MPLTLPTVVRAAAFTAVTQLLFAASPSTRTGRGADEGRDGRIRLAEASAAQGPGDPDVATDVLIDIDGQRDPDRLPETMVWGELFHVLHRFTRGKTDPADSEVRDFVEANLFMSSEDVSILLPEVARALERIRSVKGRLNEVGGDPTAKRALRRDMRIGILEDRNRILAKLSPRGAKALLRYVAVLRQGSQVSITPEALAEEREAEDVVEPR